MIGQHFGRPRENSEVRLKLTSLVFSVVQGLLWYIAPQLQSVLYPDVTRLPWITRFCLSLGRQPGLLMTLVLGHAVLVLFSKHFSQRGVLWLTIAVFILSLVVSVSALLLPFFVITGQFEIL